MLLLIIANIFLHSMKTYWLNVRCEWLGMNLMPVVEVDKRFEISQSWMLSIYQLLSRIRIQRKRTKDGIKLIDFHKIWPNQIILFKQKYLKLSLLVKYINWNYYWLYPFKSIRIEVLHISNQSTSTIIGHTHYINPIINLFILYHQFTIKYK